MFLVLGTLCKFELDPQWNSNLKIFELENADPLLCHFTYRYNLLLHEDLQACFGIISAVGDYVPEIKRSTV